jgi:hypothetical protein
MNMWPLPNRGRLGSDPYTSIFAASYSDTTNFNAGSVRIDQAIGNGMTMFGRFNNAPSDTTYRRGDLKGALNDVKTNTQNITTATVGLNWTMSPAATNEIRFNYSRDRGAGFSKVDGFGGATIPYCENIRTRWKQTGLHAATLVPC